MWVKSEAGKLHNMNFAESVEIEQREDLLVVVASFAQQRKVDLTEPKDSEVQPNAVMKRIAQSIQDNDRLLDLERSAYAVRSRV